MGIKTKFNPMGGQSEKGKLSDWRYSTADNGQITLYEYLGQYSSTKPVYVPKKGGKTVINDYTSGTTTTASNTPFYENQNVISVDLQNVPFVNNSMIKAFSNCQNLVSVNNINPNTVRMLYTFRNCYNLNQNVQIPNSVQDMQRTFYNCHNLNQNIKLSSSATVLAYTFFHCFNLNQNIQIPSSALHVPYLFRDCRNLNQNINIPDSVINTCGTFYNCFELNQNISLSNATTTTQLTFYRCYNLNQNIQIPNSVTTTMAMFQYCYNLNQNIQIPNSVTNMVATFSHCYNLNQDIQIPRLVTNMNDVFDGCTNLQGNITILPSEVTDANYLFYGCGLSKNVIFPLRYINNVNTVTRNTLVTAATGGYAVGTAVGNLVNNTAQNAVFYAYDPIAWEGYNAWTGDGVNWRLTKWGGIGKAAGQTSIKVPTSITSYDTFPTVINDTCFFNEDTLEEIDCQHVPIYPLTSSRDNHFFSNMASALSIYNFNCINSTQLYSIVYNSRQLNSFSIGTPQRGTFFLDMPSAVTNAQAMVGHTKNFSNYYLLSDSMGSGTTSLKMYACFNACNATSYNIYFTHTTWSNGKNWTRSWNSSHRKNAYFYFTYANGVATNIYNAFNVASWRGTSGGGLDKDPMYNSTSNCYAYNMSKHFCPTNNASWWCCPANGALQYTGVGYNDTEYIAFPDELSVRQYPDKSVTTYTNTQDVSNMFNGFFKINSPTTIASYNLASTFARCENLNQPVINRAPTSLGTPTFTNKITIFDYATDLSYTFFRCSNFNQPIQLPLNTVNMYATFSGCSNLNQPIEIPNKVVSLLGTFIDCANLNQDIIIGSSATNMSVTFDGCSSFTSNVKILSTNVTNTFRCFYNTTLSKNVYIPFKYSNGVNSATFNSFVAAGYLTSAGASTGQNGVTVRDLNA